MLALLFRFAAAIFTPGAAPDPVADITRLADEYFAAVVERSPEFASLQRLPGGRDDRLSDNSLAAQERWERREDAWIKRLAGIDRRPLDGKPEGITHGLMREVLENARRMRVCRNELWGVSQVTGWQVVLPVIAKDQPVGTASTRADALARWDMLPKYIETDIANLREGLRLGYKGPRIGVERVIGQVDGMLAGEPSASPFYSPAERDSTPEFRRGFEQLVSGRINPALRGYREFLQQEYLPAARELVGVAANPDGAACYRASIRNHTSLDISPDSIHQIGLDQVAKITAEMEDIAQRNFGTRDIAAAIQKNAQKPEYQIRSAEDMLAFVRKVIDRTTPVLGKFFGRLPKAQLVVEPFPKFQEASAPGGQYFTAAEDGSRPGVYRLNTVNAGNQSAIGLEALTFHEAVPGHHLETSLSQERPGAHPVTRYFGSTAFREGWALYTERVADEAGLYSSDATRLAMLGSERFRAARLVVDSGLHGKGWTRQQAVEYMMKAANAGPAVVVEIDRYIVWPGQATAYQIGNLEIRRLRQQAERTLGERFDIRAFHDEVLADGSVPLPMLRAKIARWIAARAAS